MNWLENLHAARVHPRRIRVLAAAAARLLPPGAHVLDIGCGDGLMAATLAALRPDISIVGVEVAPRSGCHISVTAFDGRRVPFPDGSFDAVLLVDVLHHTVDPSVLLREAARVARQAVLLKDHARTGLGAGPTLRFMDGMGNRRHGVALPYNYLSPSAWTALFSACGLVVETRDPLPTLYPFPANLIFGRDLHFFARLRPPLPSIGGLPSYPR
jgi:SAM-dependent methyltransferase